LHGLIFFRPFQEITMAVTGNLISGSRNADRLTARAINDTVEGLGGNDTLSSMGLSGIYLLGGDGNDTLIAKATDTLIDGGAGVDKVQFAAAVASLADTALEGVENVVITNTVAAAYDFGSQTEALNITGSRLVDSITGGGGNDTITGGTGADSLVGGAGDDVIVAEATDAKIDGTSGNDTVRFAAAVTKSSSGVYDLTDAELVNIDNVEITNTGNAEYNFGDQTEALNITGGRGKDTITGGQAADTLRGGNGNDLLIAVGNGVGQDKVDGGAGNDTVKYSAAVGSLDDAQLTNVEYVVITSTTDGVTYDFSSQSEGLDIMGNAGDDIIKGGSGADALRGGLGDDALHAGDNDKLIDGGNGTDTAVFATSVTAKNLMDGDLINVEAISITGTGAYDFSAQSEKLAISVANTVSGAVTITGGKGVDTLTGGAGDDVIVASDLDSINGGVGTDTVRFGAAVSAANLGTDDLEGVENIVITNTKAATYDFSAQTDDALNVTGGSGNDTIKMAIGTIDTVNAGAGNDVIVAEDTDYLIDGGAGVDTVQFAAAVSATNLLDDDLANVEYVVITKGSSGTYDFSVQTESLQITGTKYADTIDGGYRADTIIGGEGADQLFGNEGADVLIADEADDIDGGAGDDTVRFAAAVTTTLDDSDLDNVENIVITNTGNASYDFSAQGAGAPVENLNITGGSGNDTITGGQDADTLSGGAGNDMLVAADNDALIDGGTGTDTVRFTADVTTDLTNAELVNVERVEIASAGTYDFSVQTEGLIVAGSSDIDLVTGGSGNDSIDGGAANDSLTGGAGADTLLGGDDNDTLVGGDGVDSLLGGDGDDVLRAQDTDAKIDGGANVVVYVDGVLTTGDRVEFATGVTAVNLTDAKLVEIERVFITNTAAASYDFSAQTEALIITGGAMADTITGSRDWDSIDGAAGNDVLSGGAGNDTLKGNTGNDTLTGGAGYDVYQVDSGTDTITDLAAGETLTVSSGATAVVTGGLLDLTQLALATSNSGTVIVTGTANADTIIGTAGVDVITGGEGADVITGGAGADTFVVAAIADFATGEVVSGGTETDVLQFGAAGAITYVGRTVTSVETLDLTAGATNAVVVSQGTGLTSVLDLGVVGATLTLNKAATNFDASASGSAAAVVAAGDWHYAEGSDDAVITYYDETAAAVVTLTLVGVQTSALDGGIAVVTDNLVFTAA
jgi:Ca2+-binding RTX toxin-like protein